MSETRRPGVGMQILGWLLIIIALVYFFSDGDSTTSQYTPEGDVEVLVLRDASGHYIIEGEINGHLVNMLVDTGATTIAIPGDVAARMGLVRGAPGQALTAGGTVTVYETQIQRLRLGEIELRNVSATISPQMDMREVLLGMTALRQLEFEQRGKTLLLRQKGRNGSP